jgi:Protein of unknown function (DUF2911)
MARRLKDSGLSERRIVMRTAKLVLFGMLLVGALGVTLGVVHARQGRRVSPHESVSASVDGSDLTITYGRPSMRGRTIFGALVPYGRVWCPGADEATTLESTRTLRVGDLTVPPGSHTIWVLPTHEMWTLIISKEPSGFHTNYNSTADLGRITFEKRPLDTPVEQLTFAIKKNDAGPGGSIVMTWETTEASVPFSVIQ